MCYGEPKHLPEGQNLCGHCPLPVQVCTSLDQSVCSTLTMRLSCVSCYAYLAEGHSRSLLTGARPHQCSVSFSKPKPVATSKQCSVYFSNPNPVATSTHRWTPPSGCSPWTPPGLRTMARPSSGRLKPRCALLLAFAFVCVYV